MSIRVGNALLLKIETMAKLLKVKEKTSLSWDKLLLEGMLKKGRIDY